MHLDDELRPRHPRDQPGERRHVKMTAEDQIGTAAKCCEERDDRIGQFAAAGLRLADRRRGADLIG